MEQLLNNKISFSNLNLKMTDEVFTYDFTPEVKIEIKKYLPIEDKYDLISIAMQNSYENGHFNNLKLDMYFHLYLVYMYTNLEFTDAQKDNPTKLYDVLYSNGLIDQIITRMDSEEYDYLIGMIGKEVDKAEKYNNTIASVINNFINELPVNAEKAKETIEQFDPEAFKNVFAFVKAANGDRPIE